MHGVICEERRWAKGAGAALLLLAMLTAAGCADTGTGRWTHLDYQLSYNLPLQDRATISRPLPESELVDLTPRIYLVSDNQRHEMLGGPVDFFRNAAVDKYLAAVAIRPPQLDLFGQDLLREMLTMTDGFVLHLGDACDVSNTGEFGRFAWDMQLASSGWVMAPGNHDGYFFGISSRTDPNYVREWKETGESFQYDGETIESVEMQKDHYVSFYLAALILQDQIWSAPLAESIGTDVEQRYRDWTARPQAGDVMSFPDYWRELNALEALIYDFADTLGDETYFLFEIEDGLAAPERPHLRRVAWRIDKQRQWRSFILQEVAMGSGASASASDDGAVSLLVVDTAQYRVRPSIENGVPSKIFNLLSAGHFDFQIAGETGGLHVTQNEAAQAFSASMRGEGRNWMMASHHPYETLGRDAQSRYDILRDAGGIPLSLSAHTHAGEIRWNDDGEREGQWLEINVGSVLDAPVEFRDLQVHRYRDQHVISSQRHLLEPLLRERGLLADELPGYRPAPGDPDFYLDYWKSRLDLASDADFLVKRILLAAHLRMFRLIETDHADQLGTRWPIGPNGTRLQTHEEVVDAIVDLLTRVRKSDVGTVTEFLYELREFDRTRGLTDETRARARAYRLSQALWATQIELGTRESGEVTMDPNLSFFMLPPTASGTALSASP